MPYYLNPFVCGPDPEDDNDNDPDNGQDDDGWEVEYSDPTHFDGEPLEDLDDDE